MVNSQCWNGEDIDTKHTAQRICCTRGVIVWGQWGLCCGWGEGIYGGKQRAEARGAQLARFRTQSSKWCKSLPAIRCHISFYKTYPGMRKSQSLKPLTLYVTTVLLLVNWHTVRYCSYSFLILLDSRKLKLQKQTFHLYSLWICLLDKHYQKLHRNVWITVQYFILSIFLFILLLYLLILFITDAKGHKVKNIMFVLMKQ